jgi:KUP system potassium uptake protein
MPDVSAHQQSPNSSLAFWALTIGSIGVVYGDIGTSPLYAFREAVLATVGGAGRASEAAVLGILSLILWSLIVVVTLKYVVFLLRADNNGEGGTLALMALVLRALGRPSPIVIFLGVAAAALFYGNAVITPVLSVLSAVEGFEITEPGLAPFIIPLTIAILIGLFAVQSRGTATVGVLFGPIMTLWFIVIALLGLRQTSLNPSVLGAVNPLYGISFLAQNGFLGLVTLGAVFLAVTGAEALYADLGHFGRGPIRRAWFALVLPSLLLNYFGQGALVLRVPEAVTQPFFLMTPNWAQVPIVFLATAATIIASQAVITGTYSLSQQAIQLGLLPRLEIRHTSEAQAGQIYMPRINMFLLIGVLFLLVLFRSSTALAGAYGIAVTGTMVTTAILAFLFIWKTWQWNPIAAAAVVAPFLIVDLVFFFANLLKIAHGGWFPLVLALLLVIVMWTWRRGVRILAEKSRRLEVPLFELVERLEKHPPFKVSGTAIFLTSDPTSAPTALLHSLKHYKALHANNLILTIVTTNSPRVEAAEKVTIEGLNKTFSRMTVRYGFMESPNLPAALAIARQLGFTFDIMSTSFFLSRRSIRASAHSGMPLWQDRLFMALARNADDASSYFRIPTDRVVEIGTQVMV